MRTNGDGFARRIGAVEDLAARRFWLITTNDNVCAERFYERQRFELVAIDEGAVDRARTAKPEIPLRGDAGVEIHDELEYELRRK